jgi:hypothetical protein
MPYDPRQLIYLSNTEEDAMAKVITISENLATMTHAGLLTFLERTRRQLDRFACLPRGEGQVIRPEYDADIRRRCDALEAYVRDFLAQP